MKTKVFVLDTDFLLDCIVPDRPVQAASLGLLEAIISTGARVIVPAACVMESAHHAGRAYRTVNYFGQSIFGLSHSQAMEQVQNVFAAGWYFRNQTGTVDFGAYITNFYEEKAPYEFMHRVVSPTLPDSIEIGELDSILGLSPEMETAGRLAEELYSLLTLSRKNSYRTEEDNRNLAGTDANLYATALAYTEKMGTQEGSAVGGSCYLITSSLRFIRVAEKILSRPDAVSTRPNALLGLFRVLGRSAVSASDFVSLFDNPLMQDAVMRCREDVDTLLDMGLSTWDKSMARLTWDLDSELHERVTEVRANDARAETSQSDKDEEEAAESYLHLVRQAKGRGYRPRSETAAAVDELTAVKADKAELSKVVDDLTQRLKDVEGEISLFGRRRQRYLKKLVQGQMRPARRHN